MDNYGSYSYVFLITKINIVSDSWDSDKVIDNVLVVDNPDEALRLVNEMNAGDDAKNWPFYKYGFEAVPFKHRN